MSQTETELFNLAAQKIGARGRLLSTTQASRHGDVFNLWYPFVRKLVFRACHWPSCRKASTLPLFKSREVGDWKLTDPLPGYANAFRAPPDMLHPRQLSTGRPFELAMIGNDYCLHTAESHVILDYTFDQTNTGLWESDLFLCVALGLAAFCAHPITGQVSLSRGLEAQSNEFILARRNDAANMGDASRQKAASWHQARGYIDSPAVTQYIYPHGPLLNTGDSASVK